LGIEYPLLDITNPRSITLETLTQTQQQLAVCAEHQQNSATLHPIWRDFHPRHWHSDHASQLAQAFNDLTTLAATLQTALAATDLPIATDLLTLQAWGQVDLAVLQWPAPHAIPEHRLLWLLDAQQFSLLQQLQTRYQAQRHTYAQAQQMLGKTLTEPLKVIELAELAEHLEALQTLGMGALSLTEIAVSTEHMAGFAQPIQTLLQDDEACEEFKLFWQFYHLLQTMPSDLTDLRPLLETHSLTTLYADLLAAQQTFTELHTQAETLQPFFNFAQLPTNEVLATSIAALEQQQQQWYAYLSPAYHHHRFTVKQFLRWEGLIFQPDILTHLQGLQRFQTQLATAQQHYATQLAPELANLTTDWSALTAKVLWLLKFSEFCGAEAIVCHLVHRSESLHADLTHTLRAAYGHWWGVGKWLATEASALPCNADTTMLRHAFNSLLTWQATRQTALKGLHAYSTLWQQPVAQLHAACQQLQAFHTFQTTFAAQFNGAMAGQADLMHDSDFEQLFKWVTWASMVQQKTPASLQLLKHLCRDDRAVQLARLMALLRSIQPFTVAFQQHCSALSASIQFQVQAWLCDGDLATCQLDSLQAKLQTGLASLNTLDTYLQTQQLRYALEQQGLKKLLTAMTERAFTSQQAIQHYQYAFYYSLARTAIAQQPELALFNGQTHQQNQQRLIQLAETARYRNRQHIAHQLSQRPIPAGHATGLVSTLTEKALLRHEMRKKARHLPIRQLLKRAGNALQAIKPCFMMSPLSVAHYLAADQLAFDVLIMDEASQVRPEEALGAIARCRQFVIIGDSKQLPPTQFFEKSALTADIPQDLEKTAIEVHESILDIGLIQSHQHPLRWHYRAQHESLITFSNQHFYDGQLLIFPSPSRYAAQLGIQHHYLADAYYQNGTNRVEAERVVAAVCQHFSQNSSPLPSLGVATFNREQQELITDLLDKHCQTDAELEQKIRATEQTSEPFFIKNLENVQGDERDVVLVSSVYGKDPETQRVYQRFGPIANATGWRRLNVIFTRARQRLALFTALQASDIQITANSQRGIRAWRDYLAYSEQAARTSVPAALAGSPLYKPPPLARLSNCYAGWKCRFFY